jgi:hypothetical protein
MGGSEEKPGKKAMRLPSEKHACPRRGHPKVAKAGLRCRQTERGGKDFRDAEEFDPQLTSRGGTRIACQPLVPAEAVVGSLGAGKDHRPALWRGWESLLPLHIQALASKQLSAGPAVLPSAPVSPEERKGRPARRRCLTIRATSPNHEGVERTGWEEVWMITDPSAILFICASLMEVVLFFLIKEAHFHPCSLQVTFRCASRGITM